MVGRARRRRSGGARPGVRGRPGPFGNVGGWPTRSPLPSSRVRSTCCCTSSPPTRSTSSTSRCCPSSTPSCSVLSEQRDRIDFNQLSEFLLVAAILIELKSQKLLPGREASDEDEDLVGWEERDLLLARLLECRAYAAAADVFVALAEQASRSVPREVGLDDDFVVARPGPPGRGHARRPGPGLPPRVGRAPGAPGRPLPRHRGHRLGVRGGGRADRRCPSPSGPPPSAPWSRAAGPASRSSCASWPCSSCARWAG